MSEPQKCFCGGVMGIVKDSLGTDLTRCSNYPTCDESYYTYEQAKAHEQAYYTAHPERREAFYRKRGFYPGETDLAKRIALPSTIELHGEDSMTTRYERTHNDAGIDLSDLAAVRAAVDQANGIGHWRRVLAIYGDHLGNCAARAGGECDCGWVNAYDLPRPHSLAPVKDAQPQREIGRPTDE